VSVMDNGGQKSKTHCIAFVSIVTVVGVETMQEKIELGPSDARRVGKRASARSSTLYVGSILEDQRSEGLR